MQEVHHEGAGHGEVGPAPAVPEGVPLDVAQTLEELDKVSDAEETADDDGFGTVVHGLGLLVGEGVPAVQRAESGLRFPVVGRLPRRPLYDQPSRCDCVAGHRRGCAGSAVVEMTP